jgi:hypothetical protein
LNAQRREEIMRGLVGVVLALGLALSLLFAAAWTVARRSRLVHS